MYSPFIRLSIITCFAITIFSACKETEKESRRPNIVFIFSDDHAPHAIGAYGPKNNNPELHSFVKTPHLDRLADEGMLFANAFCTNSICGPSRAVILTGKHSHLNGMLNNDTTFNGAQTTFPKIFQEHGYRTAWMGKWHLMSDPTGFDDWAILANQGQQGSYYNPVFKSNKKTEESSITGYTATIITDMAIEWIEENKKDQAPFFLAYSHKTPHREWVPAPEEYDMYKDVDLPLPGNFYDDYSNRSSAAKVQEMEIARHMNEGDLKLVYPAYMNEAQLALFDAAYGPENEAFRASNLQGDALTEWKYQRYVKDFLRSVTSMDREIGRFLQYLEDTGLADNTIVIYSSDQGFYLGDHGWYDKRWMYEESLRMPLIIRWPGVVQPGTKNDKMVQNLDFAQTFLDMAGIPAKADMQGSSLLPLLKGDEPEAWRENIYYHYYAYPDWHMVKPHYGIRSERYKLIHYYTIDEWELFDLQEDPDEMVSVFNRSEYNEVQALMNEKLQEIKIQYGDTVILTATSKYHR
ncbi:MAG: sulfatase [Cyclobacteriaceae bacterium]|nr:sulfatase [Cyclobacteriaceae bacterium]